MEDVFAIQDDISQAIVGTLKEELVLDQNVTLDRQSRVNLDAYTLYLKGRFHWNKRTEEGLLRAIEHFERAIAKDSDFSLAHVGIADSHNILGYYSFVSPKEAFPRAKATAVKALDLDNMLAEAHASLAFVRLFYDWDWSGAEREFKTALELNPGYATAHHWYAEYLALVGRPEEAIEEAERALKYDPLSLIINTLVGWVYYYGRQYDQAIRKLRNTLELDPNFVPANFWLGLAHQQISQFGEAIAVFQKAITHTGKGAVIIAALGCAYALSGETSKAEQKLGELKEETSKGVFVPSYYIAAIHACLGEKNQALECLKNAYRVREMWLVFLKVDPIWDKIRSDQQFVELLKKVGL
ncbi:MAG: tetratricopeptide repeat protein, partial [Candidatus Binatia bacterium]